MPIMSKTRNMLEGLVREGSFSWVFSSRSSFDEEFEEMSKSPSGRRKWISELSPMANVMVGRCSRILDVSMDELRQNFDTEASDSIKHPSRYARNFLEYCCFRALSLSSQVTGHLGDKNFRRLTYDMMLAWEAPGAASQPLVMVDTENTVGKEAFSRIAPAIPTIADVITSSDLFNVLTASTRDRLSFSVYEKYLCALERAIKKMKIQSQSSILSGIRLSRGERILDIGGTVTTQPVLQHIGTSAWPGRLTLTDYALYFEPLRVVSYDFAKTYDLSEDLKQVVKPELTGPWGTRLFDKAVMYKSISLPEPVVMEFPQISRNFRRDYWLAIIREILYAHQFIRKYQIKGVEREEVLSKAVLGILRLQAVHEIVPAMPRRCEALLMFNLADQLPGGDLILETLANMSTTRELDQANDPSAASGMYSISALAMLSNLGIVFGEKSDINEVGLLVGEIVVGKMSALERAVSDSRNSFKKVERAQATIHGVKVEGIDKNLAVMKALLLPISEIGNYLLFLASWDDPLKSFMFCLVFAYVICRGWIGHVFTLLVLFTAVFMVLTRCFSQGRPVEEVKVVAPPEMNTMEQLLVVQNSISHVEELVQEGNIILLRLRALLLALFPQATERVAMALLLVALVLAFLPGKFIILLMFLEIFTRNSPPRKPSTERWTRRLKEWWFSIPAAPVILEITKEDKKSR
ncbi:hypothetical protein MRB53_018359 [Persea americana]|uniref:Uncharacterized protein n=1 Tax=Persea americana TaxID=3435 RepID=A0ACC2M7P5_PERAE|nr:hypothetical protein MRB53_018359 [Persea americana]|eukprot:TRINITY_DN4296_c0_g2_i1.p1 TRINITY_DN4296_c0_g2~~TRINITY_DN4296_c0_g2_i1.p1  ORF type:complete len:693 (+),score=111.77 TRINITY_DN4296_c0_g2_i1:679-2757(+)